MKKKLKKKSKRTKGSYGHARSRTTRKKGVKKKMLNRSRKFYFMNPDFGFFPELQGLILKSSPAELDKMISRILAIGRVKLAVISGIFLNNTNTVDTFNSVADLLIVADDVDRKRLGTFLKSLEAEVGTEVRFTLMDKEEFRYRYGMFDRFVRVLLEGPHEKIINRLGI